jgi:hypothetical protein
VALVTQLILNLLGIGIGAATLDSAAGSADIPSASSFSIGAGSGLRCRASWLRSRAATPLVGWLANRRSPRLGGMAHLDCDERVGTDAQTVGATAGSSAPRLIAP